MQRDRQHVGIAPEGLLGAVAVVHIPVHHRDSAHAARRPQVEGGDRDVAEHAEAAARLRLGMVPRWAHERVHRADAPFEHGVGRDHAASRREPRDVEASRPERRAIARIAAGSGARLLEPLEVAGLVQAEDLLVRRGARCEVHQLAGEPTRVEQVPQAPLRFGRLPVRVLLDHGRARLHHARVVPEVALVEHEADRRHADSLRTRSATHASSAARSPSLTNTSSASTRASASGNWSGLRRSKRSGPRARRISSGALISTVRS